MRKYLSTEKGLTLIEILVSIVILSIIVVSFLSMFVQSSRSNNFSKRIVDATYVAETQMEELNNMNKSLASPSLANLSTEIKKSYTVDSSCSDCFGKTTSGHYVLVQLKNVSTELGKVIVKIYKDNSKTSQEAQMELNVSWKR
ncbi:type II secretion system protein [Neobacillus cucumis]|uniref:Prepilin-type cleavage/methylation domain-containing protein n=1 Tax=Neobacillus cucumis TaxID=1740721 RepID=A0A2N5H732_9BACI|nr:type II secretion system protein [Neobacillus cucumis]PLS01316.1 hypothetical protein CVD27_26510 [Neobacillus cucumis]